MIADTSSKERLSKLEARRKLFAPAAKLIAAGWDNTVGLKSDGTVVAVGENLKGQCKVSGWHDIVAIATGGNCFVGKRIIGDLTIGLKSNGTIVATIDRNKKEFESMFAWKDIKSVAAGWEHVVGLMADGTVVAAGYNLRDQCNVSDWKNIISIAANALQTVGLKSDGTVVATGSNTDGQCEVSNWKNIVGIAVGNFHTVGLKSNGTVVAVGNNAAGQCEVSDWENIVAVSAGSFYTVGLKSDGTVVVVGDNDSIATDSEATVYLKGKGEQGPCDISNWTDVVAISAQSFHTVGLKSNGCVVAVGSNRNGQCTVHNWKLFNNINSLEQELISERNKQKALLRVALEKQRTELENELPTLKGFLSNIRRRQVQARLAEISEKLNNL